MSVQDWKAKVNPQDIELVWSLCKYSLPNQCNHEDCWKECVHIKKHFIDLLTPEQFRACLKDYYKTAIVKAQNEIDDSDYQLEEIKRNLELKNRKLTRQIQLFQSKLRGIHTPFTD